MPTLEELLAHQALASQGSVMARNQEPEWRRNLPQTLGSTLGTGAQTILDLIDTALMLGPAPSDAFGGKAANVAGKAGLGQLLSSLIGGGGAGPSAAQDAGIYRQ